MNLQQLKHENENDPSSDERTNERFIILMWIMHIFVERMRGVNEANK